MEVDESGRHSVKSINDVYIDLRESVFNFQEQQVFTKDTVLVDVDAVMYYKIVDVKKAVYEIDDLQVALCNTQPLSARREDRQIRSKRLALTALLESTDW